VERILGGATLAALVAGLVMAFGVAPREVIQGNVQRIMYLHVPMAVVAEYLACPIILVASIIYLWTRRESADRLAHAAVEVNVYFTGLAIATGSIWGKPTWGTWWTWDARITTVSLLLLLLVGYLLLRSMVEEKDRAASYAAVVGIILALDVFFIHISVYWWRTLHQPPSLLKPGPATMPASILIPLFTNICALALLYLYLMNKRLRLLRREAEVAG
jgi:heme exporter protein C